MRKLLIVFSLLATLAATPAAAAGCMSAEREASAEGTLAIVEAQDAAGRPEHPFILTLSAPACLDDADFPVNSTGTIHIYSTDGATSAKIEALVGKAVKVRGRPFGQHTAHHHAPIVMDVSAISAK